MILVYAETTAEGVNEVSLETVTFARKLSAAGANGDTANRMVRHTTAFIHPSCPLEKGEQGSLPVL